MKTRMVFLCALLSLGIMACSLGGSSSPAPAPDSTTPAASQTAPTLPPLSPATVIATRQPPTATPTLQATATVTPTIVNVVPTNTARPVSTGPLDFRVSIVKCRLDPGREGGVILTLRIDAQGGNGAYTYFVENKPVKQMFERPATKGGAVIDAYRIESGDGQTVERKERFAATTFGCP